SIVINIPDKAKANEVIEKGLSAFAKAKADGAKSRQWLLSSKSSSVSIVNPYDKSVKYTKESITSKEIKLIETDGLKQELNGELKIGPDGKIVTNQSNSTVEKDVKVNNNGSVTVTEKRTYENVTVDSKTGEATKQTTIIETEVETKDGE